MDSLKTIIKNKPPVYMLKPRPSENLNQTIESVRSKSSSLQQSQLRILRDEQINHRKLSTRFLIHTRDEARVILFEDVVCCIADSNYTRIHLKDGCKVMVSKTLKDIEPILYPSHFVRIHASSIVNLHYIKRILKRDGYNVELPDNLILGVSRSRRDELMQKMENL